MYITCNDRTMPRLSVKVYEFVPSNTELLVQNEYQTQPQHPKGQSPPLGLVHVNYNEEKKYDSYISTIVDYHLSSFADIYDDSASWRNDDDFAPRLFKLIIRLAPKSVVEVRYVYTLPLLPAFRLSTDTHNFRPNSFGKSIASW